MDVQARTPTQTSEAKAALEQIPGGRYHTVERLSTGAIGSVYKALDTILDRPVAIKSVRLDTPFADHTPDELRERFVREARIAARLQHPNIVTTHDIVATDTRGFIIMEFIEGQSLEALLKTTGRLELSATIRILAQLSSALDYAHERNVIHRDVKPSNILVSPDWNVWVTDFGIAKSELSTNLTMAGGVLGTPDYMSPEQAKGEDVDARSDLFSLGCILFECATGEKPFRNPSLTGVLLSIINDEPAFPLNWKGLGLPTRLKPILHHALEKSPEKRYPTGGALVEALQRIPGAEVASADEAVRSARPAEASGAESATENADGAAPAEEKPHPSLSPEARTARAVKAPAASPEERAETSVSNDGSEAAQPDIVVSEEPDMGTRLPAEREEAKASVTETSDLSSAAPSSGSPDPAPEPGPSAIPPERLESLKEDARPLRLAPTLSGALQDLEISPEEGFILSRVDGVSRANEILALSPMTEAESARALFLLLEKSLIQFAGAAMGPPESGGATVPVTTKPVSGGPDEETVREIERLLSLASERAWAELLGIEPGAPEKVRKSAYLRLIGRYHPDKFSWARANGFQEKLSRLCAAASEAVDELACAKVPDTEVAAARSNGQRTSTRSPGEATGGFDKRRYARELHDRALRSFDLQDFWDAIQLSRQAIEADEGQADFHLLLGRALMQNKRWRKEAADAFRRASEIEPMNVQYLGMLGAIYRAEGLSARAEAVLKRAREIDPDYELPDLESDTESTVETD